MGGRKREDLAWSPLLSNHQGHDCECAHHTWSRSGPAGPINCGQQGDIPFAGRTKWTKSRRLSHSPDLTPGFTFLDSRIPGSDEKCSSFLSLHLEQVFKCASIKMFFTMTSYSTFHWSNRDSWFLTLSPQNNCLKLKRQLWRLKVYGRYLILGRNREGL